MPSVMVARVVGSGCQIDFQELYNRIDSSDC